MNIKVIVQEESYTSKTCSNCHIITEIGSEKTWTCKTCNIKWDRDVNAARNILFKNYDVFPYKVFKQHSNVSMALTSDTVLDTARL